MQKTLKCEGEGTTSSVEIPQNNPLRRIVADFYVKVNSGSTAPSTRTFFGYPAAIRKVRLIMGSDDIKFTVTGVMKRAVDTVEFGTAPVEEGIATPAANASNTYHLQLIFDFATDRKTLSDFSALLNAPDLSSLHMYVDWGTISDIFTTPGTTAKIDTAGGTYCDLTLVEVFENGSQGEDGENDLAFWLENARDFREVVDTPHEIDQARASFFTDEGQIKILPAPARILTQVYLTTKNVDTTNPEPSDDVITYVKIANVLSSGEPIFVDKYQKWLDSQKLDYGLEKRIKGFGYMSWVDQRQGGLRNRDPDALQFKYLSAAPASGKKNGVQTYTRYEPGGV